MKIYSKSLSVLGYPLKVNLCFETTFAVDFHQSGIANIKGRLETVEPQVWADYGVAPPTLWADSDFEINAPGTHEHIKKFILAFEKKVQGEMDKRVPLAAVGGNFVEGLEAAFTGNQYHRA